ncbi:MAG: RlmE family RNA methyltransferase [Methylophilaceae bacterium]|nr:RlmE family RNA methyltransferase [Methylophilaceae bacterium]
MRRNRTSKAWLHKHLNDPFVRRANREGYRSRAAYKLMELDDKYRLIRPGMTVVDLGAAPGSWSQVVIERLEGRGRVIALDLLEMRPIPGVELIRGDFTEQAVLAQLEAKLGDMPVDLVICDMAPNISGVGVTDQARAMALAELSVEFALQWLKAGGSFVVKVFMGHGFDELVKRMRPEFDKVVIHKPKASRDRSSETYLLGMNRNKAQTV